MATGSTRHTTLTKSGFFKHAKGLPGTGAFLIARTKKLWNISKCQSQSYPLIPIYLPISIFRQLKIGARGFACAINIFIHCIFERYILENQRNSNYVIKRKIKVKMSTLKGRVHDFDFEFFEFFFFTALARHIYAMSILKPSYIL